MFPSKEAAITAVEEVFNFKVTQYVERIDDMTTLTFTIQNLYDPKPGKPTGSIKTDSDSWISYWPSDKGQFAEGGTYTAVCDARDWQGKTYYTVKSPDKGGNITSGGASAGSPQTAGLPNYSPPVAGGLTKDEIITRLAIGKSCIESNQTQADADSWIDWVMKKPSAPVDDLLDENNPF
tara:strand:- start:1086 stop:1622 length:537 start_codon:yes stop_codon:yes gene_type:complete